MDTVTPVAGPGYAGWDANRMRAFLTNARNTNTVPDIVIWHELNHTSASIAANVAAYRSLESSLGISPRPIFINEHAWTDEVDVPGRVANYVAKLERAGVWAADRVGYVDFVVNVPSARAYPMTIGYANGTGATATHGLAYNGGAWSTVSYPPTAGWAQFGTVSTTVNLRAGYDVVRLAKGSPFFGGATGFAELDYIQLP